MPVSLYIGPSFAEAWEEVILPWFDCLAACAFEERQPVAVVTPFASDGAYLRWRLLERDISLLGVRFLTPAPLREIVLHNGAHIPLREDLHLLLAIAAEQFVNSQDSEVMAMAKSVARAPDDLLRVIDQLSAAGWAVEDLVPQALRTIAGKFFDLVNECGFQLVHEADRSVLTARLSAGAPRFTNLLVTNFSSAQWHLWPLLHAAVSSAKRATVILEYPRQQTRASDEAWAGTWEEVFGSAVPFASRAERARPFADVVMPDELVDCSNRAEPQFLVGVNTNEQAQAIVAAALTFLSEKSCTRVGILFPREGELARLVSELLARSGIPHYDGIGHFAPGEFETPAWSAWLQLQQNCQLSSLLQFLDATTDSRGEVPIQTLRRELQHAYRKILIDDIAVLREYCARQPERAECKAVAALVAKIKFLPPKATLSAFLAATKSIFAELKWKNRWTEVERLSRTWSSALDLEFSRGTYLRWLMEISDSFVIARTPQSNHPYSRVHLLSYVEGGGKEWSHLILAGLNQGEWPQSEAESPVLRDDDIAKLNARAVRTGGHGEGHVVLHSGKTFLLGARERRQIALHQFVSAVESTEMSLAITASLHQDTAPERLWNPSELLNEIYFRTRRTPLTQEVMSGLQQQTHGWLDEQSLFEYKPATGSAIRQTRAAYDVRRRGDEPFGEYDFALREQIARQITLRATQWDRVVTTPALIWMKAYLDVESNERNLNEWSTATGDWVHDWLAQTSGAAKENTFVKLPPTRELRARVARAAWQFRNEIDDLCSRCGRHTPDWWLSGWSNAFALADCLVGKLTELDGWERAATEWILRSPQLISLDTGKLRLSGRIDLILAQRLRDPGQLDHAKLWIVDYKTGNKKALTATGRTPDTRFMSLRKKLVRGDAIQLGLYGLVARELGAAQIDVSLLSPLTDLESPQLALDDLAAHSDFWNELYRMQETGIFGLLGPIRSEYSFTAPYPMATLPIDKEFLQEKWALTHPPLAIEEDDQS